MAAKEITDRTVNNGRMFSDQVWDNYTEIIAEAVGIAMRNVSTYDLALDIARGNIVGSEPFGAYGKITTAATPYNVIWANGVWTAPPSTGIQVSVVSTSIEDGVGGTGIRTLHMHYLDASLNPMLETITLNGTTPVLTTATDIRFIQCAHMLTYGSSKGAVGSISFKNLAGTESYNEIDPTEKRCSSSARMVPIGKRAVITGLVGSSISGTSAASAIIGIAASYFSDKDYSADSVLIDFASIGVQDGSEAFTLPIPEAFYEGTIIAMVCSVDKTATITGDWFGWLEDV